MNEGSYDSLPIRVLLADLPGLLAGVVKSAVAMQPDMRIAGEVHTLDGMCVAPILAGIDVVVTTLSDSHVSAAYRDLLFDGQHVPLVALSPDGEQVEVFSRRVVRGVALAELVSVIRAVAHPRATRGIAAGEG